MPLTANEKEAHGYQMNALEAQFPLVYGVMIGALKRIRKLEITVDKQKKAIATLERQIQPEFANELMEAMKSEGD